MTIRIGFTKTVQYESEGRHKGPIFEEGDVYDCTDEFASRWIQRFVAVQLPGAKQLPEGQRWARVDKHNFDAAEVETGLVENRQVSPNLKDSAHPADTGGNASIDGNHTGGNASIVALSGGNASIGNHTDGNASIGGNATAGNLTTGNLSIGAAKR